MFGFSLASQIFQGSKQRTWNCVYKFANLIWGKFNHSRQDTMPRSRKRHHSRSRSRSRSRSPSRDRSYDRHKKNDSYEKDGKRRRVDEIDSPQHKRSLSSGSNSSIDNEVQRIEDINEQLASDRSASGSEKVKNSENGKPVKDDSTEKNELPNTVSTAPSEPADDDKEELEKMPSESEDVEMVSDSDSVKQDMKKDINDLLATPKKPLTPKQLKKLQESEKKRQQRQQEKEERERQKQEEKAKALAEKQKTKQQKEEEKQKLIKEKEMQKEQRRKEKEEKEEQRRKEKEEREQKRKEKEEQEAQKRKEKELEKLKKQQEIEEKNKEKLKEEEKKQKTAALFVGFFKKTDGEEKEKKVEKINCNFMPFEVKSDMRLPPARRDVLGSEDKKRLDVLIANQDEKASYLKDLKSGNIKVGKSTKTWPYEDPEDEVTVVGEDKILGETICEDTSTTHKTKAKFLFFHENRRPPYFGTWRKKSKFIKPKRPLGADTGLFNYEEDSDDDWEEEEQGESLDVSTDEDDKDGDNAEDDYEVDNDFFVPHGHLSDDEVDDEQNARLSPESLKQKLKLLKDEFDEDIKSKTHKLKPRAIGCIWYNKKGDNVEDAIKKYLQPFAMIVKGQIEITSRSEIFSSSPEKKRKIIKELPPEHIPMFLKIIHGNVNKKKVIVEQFLTYMANNGLNVEVSKANLLRLLKQMAIYKKVKEKGQAKSQFQWWVNEQVNAKYNVHPDSSTQA